MKLVDTIKYMPAMYLSSASDGGPSFMFKGRPGGGKTWTISQFPKLMKKAVPDGNYGFVVINGATLTLSTAMGYMWPEDAPSGRKRSTFTDPYWMYTKDGKHLSEYDGGIILVDDAHMLDPDLKKIMGQGAYDKILANHYLPDGWVIWFAGNRAQDRSGATREYDHLITRRIEINVTDDPVGLVDWLRTHRALPETISFVELASGAEIVFMEAPTEQAPYCNPRTLTQADRLLQDLMQTFGMDHVPTDPHIVEMIQGGIGKGPAASYINHIIEGQQLPPYAEIVKAPSTVKMPPEARPDLWRMQAYRLARDVKMQHADACVTYMERFPEEFQVLFIKAAAAYTPELITNPKVKAWCKSKAALVALLMTVNQG